MSDGWVQGIKNEAEGLPRRCSMPAAIKNKDDLIITRFFDVPRDRVWQAWSEPERFQRWW